MIDSLGYPSYFLTVADVVDLIKRLRVRAAARGSGAGSLVTYLLGISDVDPLRYGLLMERFLSPLRHQLPDIDIDVESARRMEVYDAVIERFGADRVSCISMMDTYRVRHAIRDVGAALGLPPAEIDSVAKAFPHIRADQVHAALRDLPELRASRLGSKRTGGTGDLDLLFDLVARLDGLPRHIALHPCGVLLSDATLLDRTPVENSYLGYPMSQFDKDDVEELGLLKLDLLGIRMQSAIAHAIYEVQRVDHETGRHRRRSARRPDHLRADPQHPDAGHVPDRVAGAAGAGRQVRAADVRGPDHRHLAVPARAGEERHGHPVPAGPERLAGRRLSASRPGVRPRGDRRGGGLPRAGAADRRPDGRLHPGRGRRGAPGAGGEGRPSGGAGLVRAPRAGGRLSGAGGRAGLDGARRLRLVRLLQGPRGGLRAAHLPVGLAEDPPSRGLPRRGAHPRPGHVSQAADPRRRPQLRDPRARPRRQRLGRHLPGRAPRPDAEEGEPAPAWSGPGRSGCRRRCATRPATASGCPSPT